MVVILSQKYYMIQESPEYVHVFLFRPLEQLTWFKKKKTHDIIS